ncbi:Na+-transporting NADH:ubiquinone oxidoreductase subunit D [Clostridium sporogenes]|jgi:electron transport complex protein RnfD|uniref:Ion-translocating oxidoreductase complex subunit D n=2 Tax=Clostridium TaxID=1485 RepID=A0AAE4Z234_CLOSG|nr:MULTISPECIES: RnfABCDGE type electron transport complex subunit D [Clostridium]MBE6077988.1 RnfABCDGE type electron transport complex subunit D [Clostridium lundense]MDU2831618.1 RnfABCDGE type electron transport complex subunit D [Clostridium botulinum]EDU37757.1 electron transport complex, RnfABCDGE type, D subunit [Clostridium sporogenes ATCC 15579]KIS25356.1 NADH:ubiquinone oxidoreductase [Clostridium botulinum B2 450]MCW7997676.1 Na+-transporting NADH:ubiquinone oxidoreductase subunit 
MSESMYTLSSSPHIRSKDSVQSIMRDVVIALLPATVAGIYFFKLQALLVILTAVISCVAAEYIWEKATGRDISIGDLSAVVTGMLLAFNVPPTLPLWMVVIGSFFSIIVVKQFFGGIGQNIVNPALAGRAFLLASWPVAMTTWTVDGVTTATPLAILKGAPGELPSLASAFVGHIGGCIGETSALALLIGFAYLLYRRIITWHVPVTYVGTVFVLTAIIGRHGAMSGNAIYEIFVGGLMLGAIFMATDYTTSPMTKKGQVIFAIGCGVITTVIRIFGGYPEGVSYSILLMNLFVPLIDKFVAPRVFGEVK